MKQFFAIKTILAASLTVALFMAMAGCAYDHGDRRVDRDRHDDQQVEHHDDHPDVRVDVR